MMTEKQIEMQTDPKLGRSDQVGLRLRCDVSRAEAIHRGLRLVFPGKVSRLMPSFHPRFDFCVYITARQADLESQWPEVLRKAGLAPAGRPAPPSPPARAPRGLAMAPGKPGVLPSSPLPPPASDIQEWVRSFRAAVKRVSQDLPSGSAAAAISSDWLRDGPALPVEQEEQRLIQSGLPAENILRAQIALYARSDRPELIVTLCRERRQEVLALPPSGLLVEQIVRAHQREAERTTQNAADTDAQQVAEALADAGRQIALAFLPELERLRQAARIRELLQVRADPGAATTAGLDQATTLSEQLQSLVEVAPGERIAELRKLHQSYPRAAAVQIALADAHAALGETEQALLLYQCVPADDQALRDTAAARGAELLLAQGRHAEALALLPDRSDLPPSLAGLRGAALLLGGNTPKAHPLLKTAWDAGERAPVVTLTWARALVQGGQLEEAAAPYQLLLELAPDTLSLDDLETLTAIAMGGGFGDISDEETARYYDRYVQHAGRALGARHNADQALWQRVDLRRAGNSPETLREALADWLEWMAGRGGREGLARALKEVRRLEQERAISREQRFALLEGVEPLVAGGELAGVLAAEYVSIGVDEVAERLRNVQPLPVYMGHLRQGLHFLDRSSGDSLAEHIAQEWQALAERSLALPEREAEEEPQVSLTGLRLTVVGGHSATRREAERALRERYGLVHYAEVAPSTEEHVDRGKVLERVAGSDFVAVITGYTGHDLTNHVRDLQQEGKIRGRVLWLSCRGKSGVVREIVAAASSASVE